LIDQCRHWPAAKVIDSAADERVADRREINDRW
jgi:hypothetical protein